MLGSDRLMEAGETERAVSESEILQLIELVPRIAQNNAAILSNETGLSEMCQL